MCLMCYEVIFSPGTYRDVGMNAKIWLSIFVVHM